MMQYRCRSKRLNREAKSLVEIVLSHPSGAWMGHPSFVPVSEFSGQINPLRCVQCQDDKFGECLLECAMSELVLEPAVRQLEMLQAREISVTELAEAHVAQIERLNPKLNVFADFDAERVRAQARAMDAAPVDARGTVAWSAGDGEVVDCDRRIQVRDRQPES